jgi:hypothetical protein
MQLHFIGPTLSNQTYNKNDNYRYSVQMPYILPVASILGVGGRDPPDFEVGGRGGCGFRSFTQ